MTTPAAQRPPPPLRPPHQPLRPPPRLLRSRPQLFVSFRGEELRNRFVSHVVKALRSEGVNVFIDSLELRGRDIQNLFRRIDSSKIALVIFSDRFSESEWCLDEVVRMDKRVKEGKLRVIPVFYRVSTCDVKNFEGKFGSCFEETVQRHQSPEEKDMVERWMSSVKSVSSKTGFTSEEHRTVPCSLCFEETVQRHQSPEEKDMVERWMSSVKSVSSKTGFTSDVHGIDSNLVDAIVEDVKRQLPNMFIEKKMSTPEELFYTLVLAALCNFVAPVLFEDTSFFKTPQWFVGVSFLVLVKRSFS